ncbi:laminin subunit beta-1 isoform X2 [Ischnura elegans]|uniref:laminin subunit beta-1 isoform X2 n=1 Tax=Ischnura elegans TaxID=197161 RepID=UPI001ED87837|nr:laminin subunit beta-1 isoform X2 [Ischnura elegans]
MAAVHCAALLLACLATLGAVSGQGVRERGRYPGHRGADAAARRAATGERGGAAQPHPLSQPAYRRRGYTYTRQHPCEDSSCYPATGDLLIGREASLTASSTCGLHAKERFCIVSHLENRKKCFWCDSRPESRYPLQSHRVENIVDRVPTRGEAKTWWQSENGVENVTIQLDLGAEFHFTHLIITFKTFRPAAMLIERSYDFGATWQVYRYFAHNCEESFPHVPKHSPRSLTDVVCESRYSNVAPSTEGEVIFRVLPPNLRIDDPYSEEVQNLLKMTTLRINFTKLHTLGDDHLDNRQEIKEKYYYAIYKMIVRGSCSCYGHASKCIPMPNAESREGMVHGRCECKHNTKGLNCENCEDFYNDLPWKPAFLKQTNACKACNCNKHATRCHFDEAVYRLSGNVSGGVCDGCMHNTMGQNCEQCKSFYYQDPGRDITDPEICQPCDCDPSGSLDEGICDSRTDLINGLESGRCHCKTNVDGRRCDRCKNGFWNFSEDNPDGCQACTCNTSGTIGNQGCNMLTGECTCKRYVTGRDCNQCLPEYFGLSEDRDGCKPCDCDPGGSYDSNCDVITGQCRCRPHVVGRTCNQPEQGYFTGHLDFLLYEAELARGSEKCQVIIREPFRDGREKTWTGVGFMRVFEDSHLEFLVNDIKTSMEYDIVIRYENQLPGKWDDINVIVDRQDPIGTDSPCINTRPQDDIKRTSLKQGIGGITVYPPVCLEAGKTYKIRIEFKRSDSQIDTPSASVLVDSIALVPRIDSLPFFRNTQTNENKRQEYERYHCGEAFYTVVKGNIPDVCKKYHHSIGLYVYEGAYECYCDSTGSVSNLCSSLGGQCQCKPNVVGRRCDRCAPGTFGFGPDGCRACDCNSIGALDNFCDAQTGQCKCRPNTYGRQCDQCQLGFWNFPNCQRCDCNGHADVCDAKTGTCIDCRNFTEGYNCERCIEGHYGNPLIEEGIPCRPCPCPDTADSGHSYASHCALDSYTQDVVCECSTGYAGSRCDVCADNYFGNPEIHGGSCRPCNCSNNIDISHPGNCDTSTGECLNCLFNTEGFNCEVCKANYYGDAVNQQCIECVCDILGTDAKGGPCNAKTGQCPCLPNVVGLSCDKCKENHWKIASGAGCEACDCDPVGSYDEQCNQYDGQCECKPGFGGRQCNECQANHWGNPTVECHACECNEEGSATLQCDRTNGSCICEVGIGGYNCDQCARGYIGSAPACESCGECFDNWDRILNGLRDETNAVIEAASKIKQTGATGAYTREFEKMEKRLEEVRQLLKNTTVSTLDLESMQKLIDGLRENITQSTGKLDEVEKFLENTTQRIYLAKLALNEFQNTSNQLENLAKNLKDNATRLQEGNVEGALNLTQEAFKKAEEAKDKIGKAELVITDAERQCRRTEALLSRNQDQFQDNLNENEQLLASLGDKLAELENVIPDLNEHVCDKRGEPCDPLCGGAGCGKCGGIIPCENGAVSKSEAALKYAVDAGDIIATKEEKTEEVLRGIAQAKLETMRAHAEAKESYEDISEVQMSSEAAMQNASVILMQLEEFMGKEGARPAEIRESAESVIEKGIYLEPAQIMELAQEINSTIASLTDIDTILEETADDLARANKLKKDADDAKDSAERILDTAQKVVEALDEAKEAQDKAERAIQKANDDIDAANRDLTQITSETTTAYQKANETVQEVDILQDRLRKLQTQALKNERDAKEVDDEGKAAASAAKRAHERANILHDNYTRANDQLSLRKSQSDQAQKRAMALLQKASQLSVSTMGKLKELRGMENNDHDNAMKSLAAEVQRLNSEMAAHLNDITEKSDYYRSCVS